MGFPRYHKTATDPQIVMNNIVTHQINEGYQETMKEKRDENRNISLLRT